MADSDLDLGGAATADVDVEVQVNPVMHLVAPLAAIVVTMMVRNALNKGYEKATGKKPPMPRDPRTNAMQAILWTAAITTTAAVAEVAVYRLVNKIGSRKTVN